VNLLLLADMAAAARPDGTAVSAPDGTLTCGELLAGAWGASRLIGGATSVAYVGTNSCAVPLALFAAAASGVPFAPLNYRLGDEQLGQLLQRLGDTLIVTDEERVADLAPRGVPVMPARELIDAARTNPGDGEVPGESDHPAVLLFTSGTTAEPKAAILRHRHLSSYVIGTVEFGGAGEDEAALVSVPPYHVAGLANLLSNLYAGRRIVYLKQFDASDWVRTVREERVTNAMVVPTMLARIADVLAHDPGLPTLARLSYGGSRTAPPVLRRVMELLPEVDLTHAYGLTETSSTLAVLGPEDHRAAAAGDRVALQRLSSVGKVLPTVEVEIRDGDEPVGPNVVGDIWVRGEQVAGEYVGLEDPRRDGWFPTRDRGFLDEDGYLFIEGRSDDTIIRGGENIAPAEIEDVLLDHPGIAECAVVGIPDEEWGQRIAAVVVPAPGAEVSADDVTTFARARLRSSKAPEVVRIVDALPYTETGKLLRREVLASLVS
jgi:acyl-CoA synthetase (AMP-forming)/AMP-acid ligase II